MTATTKAPKSPASGSANREKRKTHASWPKGGSSESKTASKSKKQGGK
jgi:hypothetical protein